MKIIAPVWKTKQERASIPCPPWPSDLRGKTIGWLHNIKLNGDVILDHYADEIARAHPNVSVRRARKPHSAMGMTAREQAALADCDLVLVALGD